MTEERLEEIKDSIDFQKLILDDVYANEGIELYNEVIRLKKEIEKLESKLDARKELCDNLQQRIDKAIEWINKHISKYEGKGIAIIDWDELSDPRKLLEILGDKE